MSLRQYHETLPSTQTHALALARAGAPEGTTIVAGAQTDGHGRAEHPWSSPTGGLYLSILHRAPPRITGAIPLAIGVEIAQGLADRFAVQTRIKWPNDLLVVVPDGRPPRKIAGILVDATESPSVGMTLVVGVGINVLAPSGAFPTELRDRIVSLAELRQPAPTPIEAEELVTDAIARAFEGLEGAHGTPRMLEKVRARLYGVGRIANVDGVRLGRIQALGDDGELWVDTRNGPVAIRAGDLVVEEA